VDPRRGLPAEGTTILAHASMRPVWVRRGEEEWSALAPTELDQGEPLREHLRENRFFGLLSLVEWLKRIAPSSWSPPPVRAAFLFDDPNLHWPSYGYIRYDELAHHAREHEYAATMATIPRDLWFAHPRAVRLFRDSRQRLSLALHGNDHVKRELQGDLSPEGRRSLLAQAIRRAAAFESRHGLPIAKVMIPPHGSTSRDMALEMPRLGIEAMSDSRPYPWLTRPPEAVPLAGWNFVDIVDGGLPVIPRYHFGRSREDLPLRALLGQPLILYGHHEDVAGGLATLAQAAAQVNALGDIRWCSLGEIARSNFETRQRGNRLDVRIAASVVDVDIPEGVHELVVLAPAAIPVRAIELVGASGVSELPFSDGTTNAIPVKPGKVQLRVVRCDVVDPSHVPSPRPRAWPVLRRNASELRDRMRPAAARVRRG
jgi:hypothetical protein